MRLSPLSVLAASLLTVSVACGPSGPVGREIAIGESPASNPDRSPSAMGGRSGGAVPTAGQPANPAQGTRADAGAAGDADSAGTPGQDAPVDLGSPSADAPAVDPPGMNPPPIPPVIEPPAPDVAPPVDRAPPDPTPADATVDRRPVVESPPIVGSPACPPATAAEDVLSDFEAGSLATVVAPGRGGTPWYVIALRDGATGAITAETIPARCGSTGAMRFAGLSTATQAPIVRALLVGTGDNRFFDASAYKGVRLALRTATPSTIRIKISDRNTATSGGICTDCNDHFSANLNVTADWRTFTVPFAALTQSGFGDPQPALLTSAIFGIELVVPRVAAGYELFVDDVAFVR